MKIISYGPGGFDPSSVNNNIVAELDLEDPPQEPLDHMGALATLIAVKGLTTTEEAAAAVGRSPEELIAEAQAWAVAKNLNK